MEGGGWCCRPASGDAMRCDARKENGKEGKKKRKLEVETKTKEGQGSVGERPQAESDERRRAGSCGRIGDRTG